MKKLNNKITKALGLLFTGLMFSPNISLAALINFATQPLYVSTAVAPNLTVLLDDSGSMAYAYAPDSLSSYTSTRRFRASYYNPLAYNPSLTYLAPVNESNVSYTTTFTKAWINGFDQSRGFVDLSTTYRATSSYNPSSTSQTVASNPTSGGVFASSSAYYPASYFVRDNSLAGCTATNMDDEDCYKKIVVSATSGTGGTDERQNFANWYSFYRTRNLLVITGATLAFKTLDPSVRVAWTSLNTCTAFSTTCNGWDGSKTDSRISAFTGSHKTDFYNWLKRLPANNGTPLRTGLTRIGEYYKTSGLSSPYAQNPNVTLGTESACRQNYAMLMTDGIWNSDNVNIGNLDGSSQTLGDGTAYSARTPFKDGNSSSVADIAFKYWANDLRTDLTNNINPFIIDYTGTTSDQYWNAKNDPATWQHMVTFTVGLGLDSWLPAVGLDWDGDTFSGSYDSLLAGSKSWPATGTDADGNVADLWHAAINSRGEFFAADKPTDLLAAFQTVVSRVNKGIGSSAAVAANTTSIKTGTSVYQARFNSADWSGDVLAIPVNADGTLPTNIVDSATWSAKDTVTSQDFNSGRVILTYKPSSRVGIPFRWPNNPLSPTSTELDIVQSAFLQINPDTLLNDAGGSNRLKWLRGDRSLEGSLFKVRNYTLGDIVESTPSLVEPPSNFSFDTTYNTFKANNKTRANVLYVGANDGMLHGFRATDGKEVLAYVPNAVFSNLNSLTSKTYAHKYFVNGSPMTGDVKYANNSWHSVLVSGMGSGAKGVFALDVTSPGSFTEATAANIVKFEFTDANDADVGNIIAAPSLVKMNNGKWAAVFGNGYNSTGTGQSTLYIVDIETGALIKKISTTLGNITTPNALQNPTLIDTDGNGTVDYAYAGDSYGRVWKFDLSSSNTGNWIVSFSGSPLINVTQPITSQIDIAPSVNGGYMIMFGTGKYLEVADKSDTTSNAFYGVWDNGTTSTIANLVQQTVTGTVVKSGQSYRQTSSNNVDYTSKKGWYLTLPITGERVVTNSVITGGLVYFSSIIPSTNDCSYGGTSWLMELNYNNGAAPYTAAFDTNNDGTINTNDTIVSGIGYQAISSSPTILTGLGSASSPINMVYTNQSNGLINTALTAGSRLSSRRVSWREIYKQ